MHAWAGNFDKIERKKQNPAPKSVGRVTNKSISGGCNCPCTIQDRLNTLHFGLCLQQHGLVSCGVVLSTISSVCCCPVPD